MLLWCSQWLWCDSVVPALQPEVLCVSSITGACPAKRSSCLTPWKTSRMYLSRCFWFPWSSQAVGLEWTTAARGAFLMQAMASPLPMSSTVVCAPPDTCERLGRGSLYLHR